MKSALFVKNFEATSVVEQCGHVGSNFQLMNEVSIEWILEVWAWLCVKDGSNVLLSTTHVLVQAKGLEQLKIFAWKGMPEKRANGRVMYDQQGRKSKINHEDDGELQHNGNVCSIWIMTN